MNTSMDGKQIKEIFWNDNECTVGGGLSRTAFQTLELSASHHGDHDQFWVVVRNKDGVEIERYNVNFLTLIKWKNSV